MRSLEKIRDGCRKSPFLDFGRDAYTSQLEYWIGVFDDLLVLGKKLSDFRRIAWQAAEELDLSLMACGVNPISKPNPALKILASTITSG
jgi:gamma-glutamyl:cysteine ligase YbdK (ATP-grasp superfamily)